MTERIYTIGVYIRARQPRCWASVTGPASMSGNTGVRKHCGPRSDLRKPAWLAKGLRSPSEQHSPAGRSCSRPRAHDPGRRQVAGAVYWAANFRRDCMLLTRLYATKRGSRPLIGVAPIVCQSTPQYGDVLTFL